MKGVVLQIAHSYFIENIKSAILNKIKMDNTNVSYISDTEKILSPIKVKPYEEFDNRFGYFQKVQQSKISLVINVESIKEKIWDDVKAKVYKTDPPEGFHFGMSNMEAQAYAPTYSEDDIREKELEISKESDKIYSELKESIIELKQDYGIQIIFN